MQDANDCENAIDVIVSLGGYFLHGQLRAVHCKIILCQLEFPLDNRRMSCRSRLDVCLERIWQTVEACNRSRRETSINAGHKTKCGAILTVAEVEDVYGYFLSRWPFSLGYVERPKDSSDVKKNGIVRQMLANADSSPYYWKSQTRASF